MEEKNQEIKKNIDIKNNAIENEAENKKENEIETNDAEREKKIKEKVRKEIILIIVIPIVIIVLFTCLIISFILIDNMEQKRSNSRGIDRATFNPAKPIIYLYPEEETDMTVRLKFPEKISCSYPKHEEKWEIIANPNGEIIDKKTGRYLYALYWEGKDYKAEVKDEGFIVEGKDTASFLEEKLSILGLNEREAEEFIIYWLPKLEKNKYNYIRFASDKEINEYMPIEFSKNPDTLIRVLMEFKGMNEYMNIKGQNLEPKQHREGFVAVEWGGTEIK